MKRNTCAMTAIAAFGLMAAPVFGQGTVVIQKQKAEAKQAIDTVIADKIKVDLGEQMKLSVMGRVVKGMPYSADTISESVQTLADGNRIVNRSTTKVYRDSDGRTRTDRVEASGTQVVSISDPAAGTTYMLYPQTQTAVQGGAIFVNTVKTPQGDVGFATTSDKVVAEKKAMAEFTYVTHTDGAAATELSFVTIDDAASANNVKREDLGEQLIEGVMATGTRTTTVIPAGAIGNAQPITIVSEQWYCKDLGIQVMTKFSDPRTGETTYRVTNINRAEPDPTLFQLPADYKVQQSHIKREGR